MAATAPSWRILVGDCRDVLATLPERSVHTVVTSPPYFGLRDYGTGEWEGGDPACDHLAPAGGGPTGASLIGTGNRGGYSADGQYRGVCRKCGGTRVDRQIGLEPTPQDFVEAMVVVFREVRRVLRDDGTVWLNLGDSYAGGSSTGWREGSARADGDVRDDGHSSRNRNGTGAVVGCKPKDLIGIPWMVAFALRADGWYLRSDIVWAKPSPMPESVTDRPTRSHEFIFLLTKRPRYFYDHEAIREGAVSDHVSGNGYARDERQTYTNRDGTARGQNAGWTEVGGKRNRRDVWTVGPQPFPDAHFATFPPKLIEPCVLAGAPERACEECGAPWLTTKGAREMDLSRPQARRALELADAAGLTDEHIAAIRAVGVSDTGKAQVTQDGFGKNDPAVQALADEAKEALGGYHREFLLARPTRGAAAPSCDCEAEAVPGTVLDPFNGAGTTGLVAVRYGRSYVGIELNEEYAQMARDRIKVDIRLGHRPPKRAKDPGEGQGSLLDVLESA